MAMISYAQESPGRALPSAKRSGKLAIAVVGILLGVLLLVLGNTHRFGGGEDSSPSDTPAPGVVARTTEEYRTDLVSRYALYLSVLASYENTHSVGIGVCADYKIGVHLICKLYRIREGFNEFGIR